MRTIHTFQALATRFISHFVANKAKSLEVVDVFNIRQIKGKSLKQYLVNDLDQKFFMKTFQKGLLTTSKKVDQYGINLGAVCPREKNYKQRVAHDIHLVKGKNDSNIEIGLPYTLIGHPQPTDKQMGPN
ncbi:hypothetical protein CR513_29987, partial [Mucuna pruriens]